MLKELSTRLLQHITSQNSWANRLLLPFAGKSVQLKIGIISASLVILENGNLAMAGETNIPDAKVTIEPSLLLRLLAKDKDANRKIIIEGDAQLAAELAKVFVNMRWDYEDDLSNLIGDVPANKIGNLTRDMATSVKEISLNLAEMLSEYWQEEVPLIAKKYNVEQFNTEVDHLRSDMSRFEKKLTKRAKTLSNDSNSNIANSTQ